MVAIFHDCVKYSLTTSQVVVQLDKEQHKPEFGWKVDLQEKVLRQRCRQHALTDTNLDTTGQMFKSPSFKS